MTEPNQTNDKAAEIEAFNEGVNKATLRNFELNSAMMADGINATCVALANGLAAADLIAAMTVESGNGFDMAESLLDKMLDDMRLRATAAFGYYSQRKAKRLASANDDTAVVEAQA